MRHQYRYKAIVIPKIGNKYVVVKDAKYNEYTFVTGGCKARESPEGCASRELLEESHGAIVFPVLRQHFAFSFESRHRSRQELNKDKREGVVVTMVYNVYVMDIETTFNSVQKAFYANVSRSRAEQETSGIFLFSKDELRQNPKTWRFMKDFVIPKLK